MTRNSLNAELREFRVSVTSAQMETWSVMAANADDARENYYYGVLEESVEQFAEVQEVEEAA